MTSLEAALSWTYHLAFAITVTRTWREQSRESLEPADYHAFLVALGLATIGSDEPGGTQNSSQQEDCSMYGIDFFLVLSLYRHNAQTARMTKVTSSICLRLPGKFEYSTTIDSRSSQLLFTFCNS